MALEMLAMGTGNRANGTSRTDSKSHNRVVNKVEKLERVGVSLPHCHCLGARG